MNKGPDSRIKNPERKLLSQALVPFIFKFKTSVESSQAVSFKRKEVKTYPQRRKVVKSEPLSPNPLEQPKPLTQNPSSSLGELDSKPTIPVNDLTSKSPMRFTPSLENVFQNNPLPTLEQDLTQNTHNEMSLLKEALYDNFDFEGVEMSKLFPLDTMETSAKDKLIQDLIKERDFWRDNYHQAYQELQMAKLGSTVTHTTIYKNVTEISSPPRLQSPVASPDKLPVNPNGSMGLNKLKPRQLQY